MSTFCSDCGAALKREYEPTVAHGITSDAMDSSGHSSQSDSSHHGRFLPGTKVADRYRIVSLAGKGGMGEVYRADDLKLGHTVALKFLPKHLADDPQRLDYFHGEVRLTRQISHPNVCRVYDIGEIDGQHFLSMEYVDGEDLAVLLRRIGRLPRDKGVEIAQQICAGLAAAHDKGVLHRDLKPANIMLDGRGQVRITDFGLAKLAEDDQPGELVGTPAYMAPEQLARGETSVQSDLYSLGLILHELFTGETVYKTSSIPELLQAHQDSFVSPRSELIDDMDPVVDRVILRCLEQDAHRRPKSATAVAAALPGGDPLSAALAAGETPSPQMVAAAGEKVGLMPQTAMALLGGVAVCILVICWLAESTYDVNQIEMPYAPAVLAAKAQEIIDQNLGYGDTPSDIAHGFRKDSKRFWLRQRYNGFLLGSRDYFNATNTASYGRTSFRFPPWDAPEELIIVLAPNGKLRYFRALPSRIVEDGVESPKSSTAPWHKWFPPASTGFHLPANETDVVAVDSKSNSIALEVVTDRVRTPPDVFDAVGVWRGIDEKSGEEVFVQAAAYRGKPVYFEVFSSEEFDDTLKPPPDGSLDLPLVLTLIGSAVLAWYNIRSGRGDRRGALRLASFVFCVGLIIWITQTPLSNIYRRRDIVLGLAQAFYPAARIWLYYVAMEPFVRRIWPRILISWARLLDGRFRDPIVGRDVLMGTLGGLVVVVVFQLRTLVHSWTNSQESILIEINPIRLAGTRELVGSPLGPLMGGIYWGMFGLFLLLFLRILLQTERRAIMAWLVVIFGLLVFANQSYVEGNRLSLALTGLLLFLRVALSLLLLVRFGFLAHAVHLAVEYLALSSPLTLDAGHWYFSHGMFIVILTSAVALFAFCTSLGGRSLFGTPNAISI